MEKLLEIVANFALENATLKSIILFVLSTLFIYALFRANIIYDFVEKFNKRELSKLRDLLTDKNISEKAKKTLRDKIDSIAYKNVTGITTDIYMQKSIINYYELAEGRLRYSDFKKAFAFLKRKKDGSLKIREAKLWEKCLFWIWILAAVASLIILSLLWFAFVYATISTRDRITLLLSIILFCVMSALFLSQALSIPIANKIRKEIDDNHLNLKSKKLRPYGLCEGEFTVPDDFDDPLPEDILNTFEGK